MLWASLWVLSCGSAVAGESFSCAREKTSDPVVATRTTIAGVPALVRVPRSISKPPIILWHGFGPPASEDALMNALSLDDVPAVKIFLGLPLFGARAPSVNEESVGQRQGRDYASLLFEPAVIGAAKELPAVVTALRQNGCLRANQQVALFGFSAGGAAVLMALSEREIPVRSAVTVNAPVGLRASIDALERATRLPYAWTDASRRLAERSDAIARAREIAAGNPPPALLIFHGADDAVITPKGAVMLEAALLPLYERAHANGRLKLLLAPDVSHDWSDTRSLQVLRASVADWFNQPLH